MLTNLLQKSNSASIPASINNKGTYNNTLIQTKLTIGQPNDKYEQEADRVADQVVKTSASQKPAIQRKCVTRDQEEGVQQKPILQKTREEEVQTKPIPSIMRMDEEELKPKIQLKAEDEIQTKKDNQPSRIARQNIQTKIEQSRGGGSPLPTSTRSFMESRMGADFSQVKIHNDSNAHKLSAKLNAQAFATGNNIFFNQGKYNPETRSGKHLLAHELTHTLQQGKSVIRKQEPPKTEAPPAEPKPKLKLIFDRMRFSEMEDGTTYLAFVNAPIRVTKKGTNLRIEFTGSLAGTPPRTIPEAGFEIGSVKPIESGMMIMSSQTQTALDPEADDDITYVYRYDGSKAQQIRRGLQDLFSPSETILEEPSGLKTEMTPSSVRYSMPGGKLTVTYARTTGMLTVTESATNSVLLDSSKNGYKKVLDVRIKADGTGQILLQADSGLSTMNINLSSGALTPDDTTDEAAVQKQQAILKAIETDYGITFTQEGRMLSLAGATQLKTFIDNLSDEAKIKLKKQVKQDGLEFRVNLANQNRESKFSGDSLLVGGQLVVADEEVAYIHEFVHFIFDVVGLATDNLDLENPANSALKTQAETLKLDKSLRNNTQALHQLSSDTTLNQLWMDLLAPLDTGSVTSIAVPEGSEAAKLAKESLYDLTESTGAGHPQDSVNEFMASYITTLTFARSKFIAAVKEGKTAGVPVAPKFRIAWDQFNDKGLNLGSNPF
ncbi:MAG: DUF4157 domain-containing protein [Roseivirga sp.]|nr:DUF4157 domain-containing protein [Roseivirga sp.]